MRSQHSIYHRLCRDALLGSGIGIYYPRAHGGDEYPPHEVIADHFCRVTLSGSDEGSRSNDEFGAERVVVRVRHRKLQGKCGLGLRDRTYSEEPSSQLTSRASHRVPDPSASRRPFTAQLASHTAIAPESNSRYKCVPIVHIEGSQGAHRAYDPAGRFVPPFRMLQHTDPRSSWAKSTRWTAISQSIPPFRAGDRYCRVPGRRFAEIDESLAADIMERRFPGRSHFRRCSR